MHKPKNPIRIVTAASLFDGHDASINIVRRMLQDAGCEVIHLGHNRSVMDIVTSALQESAQGICVSSYQGGHMEFFKYMRDLLAECGANYVKIYGGGGGTITPKEKHELEDYGIAQIFHPEDGRKMGLDGMVEMIVRGCDYDILKYTDEFLPKTEFLGKNQDRVMGLAITSLEINGKVSGELKRHNRNPLVIGVTGTGGAGKSSVVDELVQRFLFAAPEIKIGIFSVDPTKRKTGGALLGDRIRMNSIINGRAYMRSIASRGSGKEISDALPEILNFGKGQAFDLLIAETSGIGQSGSNITDIVDMSLYVMTSEFGAQSQLEKIDMIDYADFIAINKADRKGSQDALRDVRKQYRRSKKLFTEDDTKFPIYLTQASQFNDEGLNYLFFAIADKLFEKSKNKIFHVVDKDRFRHTNKQQIIPADRQNYLAEVAKKVQTYKKTVMEKARVASEAGALKKAMELAPGAQDSLEAVFNKKIVELGKDELKLIEEWEGLKKSYSGEEFTYQVRGKDIKQPLVKTSLSGTKIKRVTFPDFNDWGDRYRFLKLENTPGNFPFTSGVYPLKRQEEEPRRQFAGEGTPDRTNRRFKFLTKNDVSKRLSVAFDSVTLYGEDPDRRPDIYGKVGESGVSICTLNDMRILLDGFDLCDPRTSVSMTINGPAPIVLAFFMNAAIDQQVDKKEKELGRKLDQKEWSDIKLKTLEIVRGTVQADILKEDQAQNTCIFSTDFALKMMGDIQEYFAKNSVRNFYSVSISGYHIAEAGANPISQLAFTLANGFTYIEYYLSRGMKIDEFAPNLSFFFSNGLDPEYSVLGRVARRIWSISLRDLYHGNERSQKLKYHIQTSGRSLHAQEISFNDIRTTLQALIAIYDNCNSLHTNAYDEAITTPTEESVRRAMAIQMIINREFGPAISENTLQGSFFFEELTDLVEEAVLSEFLRLNERGGVLGAMETQYQRSRIQEESFYYEHLKHSGALPIVGVNTFVDPHESTSKTEGILLARATKDEKEFQLKSLIDYQKNARSEAARALEQLKATALQGGNIFEALMTAARSCSLGQMTQALYEVGGQYRRNI